MFIYFSMAAWCSLSIRELREEEKKKETAKIYCFRFAMKIIIASASTALYMPHSYIRKLHNAQQTPTHQYEWMFFSFPLCKCSLLLLLWYYLRVRDLEKAITASKIKLTFNFYRTQCILHLNHLFSLCLFVSSALVYSFSFLSFSFLCFASVVV